MSNITGIIKSIRDIMRKDTGVDGDAQRKRIKMEQYLGVGEPYLRFSTTPHLSFRRIPSE
jgi:hypothetical protein